MDLATQIATLALVHLLACISPGPDFINVAAHALSSRKAGIRAALGVASGCMLWACLAILGLGFVLSQAAWLYETLRVIGVLYLVYLGVRLLVSAYRHDRPLVVTAAGADPHDAFKRGFLVNVINPKAAAYFGSLFVSLVPAAVSPWMQGMIVALVPAITFAWFCPLALMFSAPRVRHGYERIRKPIDIIMGGLLVTLGIRLAITR